MVIKDKREAVHNDNVEGIMNCKAHADIETGMNCYMVTSDCVLQDWIQKQKMIPDKSYNANKF